ncbi:MAG: hypothetical protein WBL61_09660 [Bryobacteraceae bacterium]
MNRAADHRGYLDGLNPVDRMRDSQQSPQKWLGRPKIILGSTG